jgi:8-oxo-dGTP pyrophosphatase MutT (NUDIX family)
VPRVSWKKRRPDQKADAPKQKTVIQCAALPLALIGGELMVMLVTSRTTRRWILPKGWIKPGMAPHDAAAREAFEKAGLAGTVDPEPIGSYSYAKVTDGGREVKCKVRVFRMRVERQEADWPERTQRDTRWFTLAGAALAADDGKLVTLLLRLAAPSI